MKKNFDYSPIKFRPRRCRFCGKRGANFVPELGKGFAHWPCWKEYEAQQSVHPTVATVAAQEVKSDARNSG